jgi:nucleoid DNA-binding protein
MDNINNLIKAHEFEGNHLSLKDSDVIQIWDEVSNFIEKFMSQSKGVAIPGFGTFSFIQKKIDVGNNKYILTKRPVFAISEKFAQTHGLKYAKYPVNGSIPVHPLNYTAIANETAFKRDDIDLCVKHVLQIFNRSVSSRKNVEFTFTGIGKLQIKDYKVKMRFFKEFVNACDGSGKVVEEMQNVSSFFF